MNAVLFPIQLERIERDRKDGAALQTARSIGLRDVAGELSAARQNSTAVYEYRRGEAGVEMVARTVAAGVDRFIDPDTQDGASRNDDWSWYERFG